MVYMILLVALMFLAFIDHIEVEGSRAKFRAKLARNIIFFVVVISLIIIAGLRYYTGFDYESYVEIFNRSAQGIPVTNVEWGYRQLNVFFSLFMNNSWGLFLFVAFVTIALKAFVIKKESEDIFLALLITFSLYFLIGDMGQIRSTLAQSIDLFAIYLFLKGGRTKTIIAIVLVIFSVIFHVSSICMLLMFVIGSMKFRNRVYIITYIVLAIGGHFLDLQQIGLMAKSFGGTIGTKIYSYTTNPEFAHKIGLSFSVILDFILLVFLLYMKEVYNLKKERKFRILFNVYFIGVCSYLVFNNYFVLAVRFANYYRLALILLLPMAINRIRDKRIRMLVLFVIIMLFSLMFIRNLTGNIDIYMPYRIDLFGYIIGG